MREKQQRLFHKVNMGYIVYLFIVNLTTLREFYSNYVQKQINDNEMIQIMPFYETENSVREILSELDGQRRYDQTSRKNH